MQRAHAEEVEMKRIEMEDKERKLREEQEAFKIESDKKLLEMHRLNEDLQRQVCKTISRDFSRNFLLYFVFFIIRLKP